MAGPPGQNGRSVPSRVERAHNKEAGHVMPLVTPAAALPSKPADAVWENATAVVRQVLLYHYTVNYTLPKSV